MMRGAGDDARIAGDWTLAAVGENLDQASISFQSHAQHCACSRFPARAIIADSPWIQ
jgi:hypothetical protein